MTYLAKKQFVLDYIAQHNDELVRQAKYKIDKRYANAESDHRELVSDVIYSIIKKLDSRRNLDRYYNLAEEDKLFNYMAKAVDTNCKRLNAPFLRNKLKVRNRIIFSDAFMEVEISENGEPNKELVNYIYSLLGKDKAPKLFGPQWKYFVQIFTEYINEPKCSYQTLADRYDIPKPTIAANIMHLKKIIRKDVQKNFKGN